MNFKTVCQALMDKYVDSYRGGDASGCASINAARSALHSSYGAPALGRAAIIALHNDWLAEGGEDKVIDVVRAGCASDLGWCLAQFSDGDSENGVSLSILEKQPDGRWLITQSSLNEVPR